MVIQPLGWRAWVRHWPPYPSSLSAGVRSLDP